MPTSLDLSLLLNLGPSEIPPASECAQTLLFPPQNLPLLQPANKLFCSVPSAKTFLHIPSIQLTKTRWYLLNSLYPPMMEKLWRRAEVKQYMFDQVVHHAHLIIRVREIEASSFGGQ